MSMDFFNLPNPSCSTMALWSKQPLTEMNTRNFPGGKEWLAGWHVRLTTSLPSVGQLPIKCGSLDVSQPYKPLWPLRRIALPFFALTSILKQKYFQFIVHRQAWKKLNPHRCTREVRAHSANK
jgi:hypothetical protein